MDFFEEIRRGEQSVSQNQNSTGHRARLRQRFLADPNALSSAEIIELLLTYAIPRRDVGPVARTLLERFGSAARMLTASPRELGTIEGIGEHAATLIALVAYLAGDHSVQDNTRETPTQPALIELEPDLGPLFESASETGEAEMRTYANDEIANILTFLPKASQFETLDDFRAYLVSNLPYSSQSTRVRRANYIVKRLFPDGELDLSLTFYAANCSSMEYLKPAVFYRVLKSEPLAAKVAEEFVWPALPMGQVDREAMREFVLRHLPDIGASSQKNILRSVFNTYDLLGIGEDSQTVLQFRIRPGTLEGFLYVLSSEFPEPGMYDFESLEQGPMRRWLLWDRDWMRRQLYNLRDLGIISKISEIDAMRQFTLQSNQWIALHHYFEQSNREGLALREQ